jgi:hypothetical protein
MASVAQNPSARDYASDDSDIIAGLSPGDSVLAGFQNSKTQEMGHKDSEPTTTCKQGQANRISIKIGNQNVRTPQLRTQNSWVQENQSRLVPYNLTTFLDYIALYI